MNENKKNKPVKFALDSSAAFYPYFTTRKAQSMYCVGAVLDGDIDREVLKRAVNDALNRFPLYKTKVIRGYGSYMQTALSLFLPLSYADTGSFAASSLTGIAA